MNKNQNCLTTALNLNLILSVLNNNVMEFDEFTQEQLDKWFNKKQDKTLFCEYQDLNGTFKTLELNHITIFDSQVKQNKFIQRRATRFYLRENHYVTNKST